VCWKCRNAYTHRYSHVSIIQVSSKILGILNCKNLHICIFLYVLTISIAITIRLKFTSSFVVITELSFKKAHYLKPRQSIHRFITLNFLCGYGYQNQNNLIYKTIGAPKGDAAGLHLPPPPQTLRNRNLKNTDFVYIMISKVLRDFPFSRNQPLKSADD
jgi:hypothetical protein